MKMLYSIVEGIGSDPSAQIAAIIRKNNEMVEKADEIRDSDAMASYTVLFMAPSITGSAKLVVDMVLFLLASLTMMGNS